MSMENATYLLYGISIGGMLCLFIGLACGYVIGKKEGGYVGPKDSKPMQPHQKIDPRPRGK